MDAKSIAYSLIVEYASDSSDNEEYRQGYWDAIVHTIQLAHGIGEDEATQWVHAQYTAICDADRV